MKRVISIIRGDWGEKLIIDYKHYYPNGEIKKGREIIEPDSHEVIIIKKEYM